MNPDQVRDRMAIAEVINRYCDAITRGDWDAHEACFAPDAVWEVGAPFDLRHEGAHEIRTKVEAGLSAFDFLVQNICSMVIDLEDGQRATARVTMQETGRSADGERHLMQYGVYHDQLVDSGTGWRFARRRFEPIYVDTTALPGMLVTPRSAMT